jgi:eukaryotic-like serine/threonine-protein kinase
VYSAAWDGNSPDVYSTRGDSPESRSLNLPGAQIAGISSSGEMAVLVKSRAGSFEFYGTLARISLAGGAPREIVDSINWADWSTDGSSLAIARHQGGFGQLEFPIGKALFKTAGWVGDLRVSPRGGQIAFIDHPWVGDDGGSIAVLDTEGNRKALSSGWASAQGLVWSPNGDEVWFTATKTGINRGLYAVDLSGKERLLASALANASTSDGEIPSRFIPVLIFKWNRTRPLPANGLPEEDVPRNDFARADFLLADLPRKLFAARSRCRKSSTRVTVGVK